MILSHKNCNIKISNEKIECEYLFLANKTVSWEISLNERLKFQEIILIPEEIIEFQFEIEDIHHKGYYQTQEAVIYYLKKSEAEPKEFFRFCVIEETKLSSQTKSYEFANEILKAISKRYNIPFSYKYYVETKKKRNGMIYLFAMIIIAIVFGIFSSKLK
ncbi:hypothetical protein FLJC2902T_32470 [Flavobacterium limnosediminis JC2902]|uniref:Uncharacterized protein n=1 Tax=Flavobacterium limnosediminis JC2902 TaxID=1341181 RepID=V6S7Z5_9FLAO|nr:hypothetical protein [Flavobacterium limnosediminis]ESU22808.1 hypothetical protein FLJC2902T_32470 [Flavobacterium limnosediminis JC2902]